MGYCDNILTGAIKPNCEDPIVGGIEANGVIINKKDIDLTLSTWDATRKNVLSKIVLKTGKKAFDIHVPTNSPFSGTVTTLEVGTNRNTFTNTVGFIILDNGPDVLEKVIDPLSTGDFVIVYENKFKSMKKELNKGDSAFQVVGFDQGLKATTLENDKWSEDTEGGWNVVLTEAKAPRAGVFLFDTDYEKTQKAVEALFATV